MPDEADEDALARDMIEVHGVEAGRGRASECPHRRACRGGCIGEALDQSSGSRSATER